MDGCIGSIDLFLTAEDRTQISGPMYQSILPQSFIPLLVYRSNLENQLLFSLLVIQRLCKGMTLSLL